MLIFKRLNYDMLNGQALYVVRELGRAIGVKSPTSKSKKQLIKEIIDIQEGRLKPYFSAGKGAPVKNQNIDLSQFLEDNSHIDDDPYSVKIKQQEMEEKKKAMEKETSEEDIPGKLVLKDIIQQPFVEGILEQPSYSYGFLRTNNYENSPNDVYISQYYIRKFNLRPGDKVIAEVQPPEKGKSGESPAVSKIITVNDFDPFYFLSRSNFDDLEACYPTEKIKLTSGEPEDELSLRLIDIFAPIGKGQRGLIVAPPKVGKTTLLKMIASAIEKNNPKTKLIVLLIDERPEEVTDFKRDLKGEVVFSTFDEKTEHHVKAAELVINRAKRLLEGGRDVIILLDSITRLTRAYNNTIEPSGKTLTGGIDPQAMWGAKKIFGAARNIEDGGSITILATALIDTGSRMDEVIYEEIKGRGNMEIHLSRGLSEKRIFPAIDIFKSGTRKDELLLTKREQIISQKLRNLLVSREDATESLLSMFKKTKNNREFLTKAEAWIKIYEKDE